MSLKIGDVVKIKNDLIVEECYPYSETDNDFEIFINEMSWTKGKEVMILAIEYNENGSPAYICDYTGCLFTQTMFDLPIER